MKNYISLFLSNNSLPHASATNLTQILNIFFEAIGALAFLMVVIGGFRYILAGSNADSVASARRQIIYSVVGLVVIGVSASIVNIILGKL